MLVAPPFPSGFLRHSKGPAQPQYLDEIIFRYKGRKLRCRSGTGHRNIVGRPARSTKMRVALVLPAGSIFDVDSVSLPDRRFGCWLSRRGGADVSGLYFFATAGCCYLVTEVLRTSVKRKSNTGSVIEPAWVRLLSSTQSFSDD
jgi:hypothetical protein